ncbi:MAG TPA: DUF4919 domain-containing protein, partial [Chitinophagaceae bacterium]
MKITLTALFSVATTFLFCQDFSPVDRQKTRDQVMNSNADTYYPKLLRRYEQFDTSLTPDQYRLLYYGFVFQKEYSGYNDNRSKEIQDLIKYRN